MNTLLKNLRSLYNAKYIKNSSNQIIIRSSHLSLKVLDILKREGYIEDFQAKKTKITVTLPILEKIHYLRIPKITRPKYYTFNEIENSKKFSSSLGITLFSTSQGIFTYSDLLKRKIGGIFLFEII